LIQHQLQHQQWFHYITAIIVIVVLGFLIIEPDQPEDGASAAVSSS